MTPGGSSAHAAHRRTRASTITVRSAALNCAPGKGLIAWNEQLDAVLEVIHEVGPEFAITLQALETQRSGTFFFSKERRLILATAKGAWMYDYDLKPLDALEAVAAVERVVRATPRVDPIAETAEWIHP